MKNYPYEYVILYLTLRGEMSTSKQKNKKKAVAKLERDELIKKGNEAYAALKKDPEAWAEILKEREEWDQTLLDGLDDL